LVLEYFFLFFEITCLKHSRWSVGKRFIIRPFRVWSTIHYTRADSVCYFLRWTAKWIGGEWSKKEIKRSGDGMTEFSHSSAGPSSFFRGRRNCYTVTSNNNGAISPSLFVRLFFSLSLSFLPSLPLISNHPLPLDPSDTLSIHPSDLPCETRVDRHFWYGLSECWCNIVEEHWAMYMFIGKL